MMLRFDQGQQLRPFREYLESRAAALEEEARRAIRGPMRLDECEVVDEGDPWYADWQDVGGEG